MYSYQEIECQLGISFYYQTFLQFLKNENERIDGYSSE